MRTTGILLLIIGLGLTIFTTLDFFTKEKVVEIGSVEITRNKDHLIKWSPIIGIFVMGIGAALLWKESKRIH
jgi:hypothetical protein